MQVLFAAYSSNNLTRKGYEWLWHPAGLPPRLLQEAKACMGEAGQGRPGGVASAGRFAGGVASLADGWCLVYRFLDGGRDAWNRPGRVYMACAFIQGERISDRLAAAVAVHPTMKTVSGSAPATMVDDVAEEATAGSVEVDEVLAALRSRATRVDGGGLGGSRGGGPGGVADAGSQVPPVAVDSHPWRRREVVLVVSLVVMGLVSAGLLVALLRARGRLAELERRPSWSTAPGDPSRGGVGPPLQGGTTDLPGEQQAKHGDGMPDGKLQGHGAPAPMKPASLPGEP